MASLRGLLCGLAGLAATAAAQSHMCYFPNGKLATALTVCQGTAACCEQGDSCLGSGLCQQDATIYRGGCTDKDWQDDSCASACADGMCGPKTPEP